MDIYEIAMKMELEGEEYYKKQMDMAENKGIKSIFKIMGDEERKHYEVIKNIKNNYFDCNSQLEVDKVDSIFSERLKSDTYFTKEVNQDDFLFSKINIDDTVRAYRHALKLEKESIDFYTKQVKESKNECDKKIFERLVIEENKHYETIDNLLDHVTKSERWLEDARFNNMEDY